MAITATRDSTRAASSSRATGTTLSPARTATGFYQCLQKSPLHSVVADADNVYVREPLKLLLALNGAGKPISMLWKMFCMCSL